MPRLYAWAAIQTGMSAVLIAGALTLDAAHEAAVAVVFLVATVLNAEVMEPWDD